LEIKRGQKERLSYLINGANYIKDFGCVPLWVGVLSWTLMNHHVMNIRVFNETVPLSVGVTKQQEQQHTSQTTGAPMHPPILTPISNLTHQPLHPVRGIRHQHTHKSQLSVRPQAPQHAHPDNHPRHHTHGHAGPAPPRPACPESTTKHAVDGSYHHASHASPSRTASP
jgi:hypothetical protein